MANVRIRMGNIFEGAADVTVLPCSAKGTFSSSTRNWLTRFAIPTPEELGLPCELGGISRPFALADHEKITKYVVFAASVLNDFTSTEAIAKIGEQLGQMTQGGARISLIESPLLGTGAGRLSNEAACEGFYRGFTKTAREDATLCIFVYDNERTETLNSLLARLDRQKVLEPLASEFKELLKEGDKQAAGYRFEKLLNRLFTVSNLEPHAPFRVTGEQIDGSFDLDSETYLLEAKWQARPLSEAPLLVFRGKIEGKSAYTRGALFTLNGITPEAERAVTTGKQATFFVVDGRDLESIVAGSIWLSDLLRGKRRALCDKGMVVCPASSMLAKKPFDSATEARSR